MANSYIEYDGNGIRTTWTIPFGFLAKNHIQAQIDEVETSDFEVVGTSIVFDSAPANETVVKVLRVTPRDPIVKYVDGASPTAEQLNIAVKQALYVSQELEDGTLTGTQVIPNNSITLSKLQQIGSGYWLGRVSASTGDIEVLTTAQLKTALSLGDSSGLDVGTTAGTVAAGDDSRITGAVQSAGAGLLKTGTELSWKPNRTQTKISTGLTFTGASYQVITGLTATITPVSASNKVNINAVISVSSAADSNAFSFSVYKNGVFSENHASKSNSINGTVVINFDDSPATTSAVTYDVRVYVSSGTCYINRDSASGVIGISTITLTEVP